MDASVIASEAGNTLQPEVLRAAVDESLPVLGSLTLYLADQLATKTTWRGHAKIYLAYRPLWELAVLQYASQHIEDVASCIRTPSPRIDRLVPGWSALSENKRAEVLCTLLGVNSEIVMIAHLTDVLRWFQEIEDLARQEVFYRTAVDDRPTSLLTPLIERSLSVARPAATSPPPSSEYLTGLLLKLPSRQFRIGDLHSRWDLTRHQTNYRLQRLKALGFIKRSGHRWTLTAEGRAERKMSASK